MDYKSANERLQGRCYASRKIGNNTYLRRAGGDWSGKDGTIAVRFHSTDVVTFHKNGDVTLNTGGWNTVTTKGRIAAFQDTGSLWSDRGTLFFSTGGYYDPNRKTYVFQDGMTVTKRGRMKAPGGKLVTEKQRLAAMDAVKSEWREFDREAARVSRWLSKARGLKTTTRCGKRWQCETRVVFGRRARSRWGGQLRAGTYDCGCVVERVQHKTKLTVAEIMAEPNITVRMAMAHVYGLERFLLDAGAKMIDTIGEYSLLDMPMGGDGWRSQTIRALKMTCPSTGAVYISPVDPGVRNVSEALDWYFQTKDYLKSVTQES